MNLSFYKSRPTWTYLDWGSWGDGTTPLGYSVMVSQWAAICNQSYSWIKYGKTGKQQRWCLNYGSLLYLFKPTFIYTYMYNMYICHCNLKISFKNNSASTNLQLIFFHILCNWILTYHKTYLGLIIFESVGLVYD